MFRQNDRHANAAVSSLLLYLYASAATLLTLECLAYFRAITRGVIGGLAKAYACLGWGIPVILLGLTWFLYGNDIGTDPECFIGWEAQTKLPNFAYSFACSAVSMEYVYGKMFRHTKFQLPVSCTYRVMKLLVVAYGISDFH